MSKKPHYINKLPPQDLAKRRIVYGLAFFLLGLILAVVGALLGGSDQTGKPASTLFSAVFNFGIISFGVGIVLLCIGFIGLAKASKYATSIAMVFFGIFGVVFGAIGTWLLNRGDVSGVYAIGCVPLPLIVITLAMIAGGFYSIIAGIFSAIRQNRKM
jgi:hypothetical protein